MKEINNNIEEAYCSFEVSNLLFEKGFTQNQTWCYYRGTSIIIDKMPASGSKGRDLGKDYIPCFTLDLGIEWIRVNWGIYIQCLWSYANERNEYHYEILHKNGRIKRVVSSDIYWKTPQEAKEAAILYTLKNLI